jgi:general L-amino acid transport system substrate-binding protein
MFNNKLLQSRWMVFVIGMVIGWLVLAACAAATETPAAEAPAAEEPAAEEAAAEEPAAEEAAAEEPAAEEPAVQAEGGTLAEVQARGVLKCGVNVELPGFGTIDADGNNVGFDVDFCKAIAAAVFGDATAVEYIPLNADQRLPALQTGEIDVLIRNTTWTLTRDTDLGLDFTVTTFYDGQGYMVRAGEFDSVEALDGGTVCVTSGTTTELNLADDFARRGLTYTASVFSSTADTNETFTSGSCDAETSDKSQLAALRSADPNPEDYIILPDTISKEPLGPVVRANDSDWRDVVMWTVFAMFEAEEVGVNQANVDDHLESDNPAIQKLLGLGDSNLGALLGLEQNWAYQIIKQVGSYADVYERHLTPIGITREGSANALWTDGGLIYSPAMR